MSPDNIRTTLSTSSSDGVVHKYGITGLSGVAAGDEVPGRKLSRGLLHPELHVLARYPHQEQLRAEIRLCHHPVNVVPEFEKVLLQFRGMLGLGQLGQGQGERGRQVRVEPGGGGGGRQSGGGVVLSCSAMSCSVTSESLGLFLVTDNVVSLAKTSEA